MPKSRPVKTRPIARQTPLKGRRPRIRRAPDWRARALALRRDDIDPAIMAHNASLYAECASLFSLLSQVEASPRTPINAYLRQRVDKRLEESEDEVGFDAPVLAPLIDLFADIEEWQREHLVDEATLAEVLIARTAIAIQSLGIEPQSIFRRAVVEAQAGFTILG